MAVKNVEKTIRDRIVTDLQGINGEGNYNFSIPNNLVFYKEFKLPEQINAPRALVMGLQRMEPAIPKWRTDWEMPMRFEIWGYARNVVDPAGDCNKLLSDVRNAITADEHLNEMVTELTFESEMEVIETEKVVGIFRFIVIAVALHQS